jgi:hypothetical protein
MGKEKSWRGKKDWPERREREEIFIEAKMKGQMRYDARKIRIHLMCADNRHG